MRYLVNKFVVIMVMVALFVLVSASCDNVDIRMLMKKEVPFISKDINQAKELKLFLAEYNVLTVNTKTNLPVFIDEVWFEKKAYSNGNLDSLKIYDKPRLNLCNVLK